jgi:hypothetical protein
MLKQVQHDAVCDIAFFLRHPELVSGSMAQRCAEMRQMKLKRLAGYFAFAIVFMAIGYLAPKILTFFHVDTCLDAGGAWDYQFERCRYR